MNTRFRFLRSLLFTMVGGSFLSSCCTKPPSGNIYLDRPEVFTRERLVNRRLADLQWLEEELSCDAFVLFQREPTPFEIPAGKLTTIHKDK